MVAFEVVTGPWRRTWVRFGHDLRADPRSRFLQVVDTNKPAEASGKTRPAATVQLCDLGSRAAQDATLAAPRARSCDPHTGWFARNLLDDVIRLLLANDDDHAAQPPLTWREFLDVAAVADLQTALLPERPGEAAARKRPRPTSREYAAKEDEEEEVDDDDDEEDDLRQHHPAVQLADASQTSTAFAILGDDDDDDDEDDDDDD